MEDCGHIGAHINHRIWLAFYCGCFFTSLQSLTKLRCFFTHAQNSHLSSNGPVRQQATTQIYIFNVSLASLRFVSPTVHIQILLNKVSFLFICYPPTHTVTDRQAGTDTQELRL